MKLKILNRSEAHPYNFTTRENIRPAARQAFTLQQLISAIQLILLLLLLILFFSACENGRSAEQEDIRFNKQKWTARSDGNYIHQKRMINDLLNHYKWV